MQIYEVSGLLVHNISDCLQTAAGLLDETRERKRILGIRNLEEISYGRTTTHPHLCAKDVHSRPFSIYVYGNTTP